ncbi:hypothetical protein HGRIS_010145 [Hohenbuehelia grisea]|uniref:Uncharacterized protein n=1 Tax=Hohenbuehelia grisea TaxID=104357 RepID=A0ABR3J3D1_9AGAR
MLWKATLKYSDGLNDAMLSKGSEVRATLRLSGHQNPHLLQIAKLIAAQLLDAALQRLASTLRAPAHYIGRAPARFRIWFDLDRRQEFIETHFSSLRTSRHGLAPRLLWHLLSFRYLLTRLFEYFAHKDSRNPPRPISLFLLPDIPHSDAMAVIWILDTVTEPSTRLTAMQMVTEVDWPAEIDVFPLVSLLCSSATDLLSRSQDIHTRPELLARAIATSKALTHLFIERLSIGEDLDNILYRRDRETWSCVWRDWIYRPSNSLGLIPSLRHNSYLLIAHHRLMDRHAGTNQFIVASEGPKMYAEPITPWKTHFIPLTMACRKASGKLIMDAEFECLCRLLGNHTSLPNPVVADLLMAAGIILGVRFRREDLLKNDKSLKLDDILEAVLPSTRLDIVLVSSAEQSSRSLTLLGLIHSIYMERCNAGPLTILHALWCLLLSRHLASHNQHPHFKHLKDHNLVAFDGNVSLWALRLCAESAGFYSSSHSGLAPTKRMWNLVYRYDPNLEPHRFQSLPLSTASEITTLGEWLLALACNLKYKCERVEDVPQWEKVELQNGVADAVFALSTMINIFPPMTIDTNTTNSRKRLLEAMNWSLATERPTHLREAALKLLSVILHKESYSSTLCVEFTQCLFRPLGQMMKLNRDFNEAYEGEHAESRDFVFLCVVQGLAEFGTVHQSSLCDHLIPPCVEIILHAPSSRSLGWVASKIFVEHGLMPAEEHIDEVHQFAWKALCHHRFRLHTASKQPTLPLIHDDVSNPEFSVDTIFRFQPRLKAAIDWLQYCRGRFALGDGPETYPEHYSKETLESDVTFMNDALGRLQEVMARWEEV